MLIAALKAPFIFPGTIEGRKRDQTVVMPTGLEHEYNRDEVKNDRGFKIIRYKVRNERIQ